MTNISGYFNPNTYRVNVSISELNISVELGPMEFILDRAKHKINDPILDRYVGCKMLSPEISQTPVPVRRIPIIAPTRPISPGHVVHQGVKDAAGRWVPALPAPANPTVAVPAATVTPPPMVNSPSIRAMSIDEARRAGYVGRSKLVSEDYGMAESDTPRVSNNLPEIKYSIESFAPKARAGNLPQELLAEVQPGAMPLVKSLEAAAAQNPEKVNLSRRAAEEAVMEQQGKEGVQQFRQTVKQIKKARPVPPPQAASNPSVPRRRVAQVVAAPVEAQPAPLVAAPAPPAPVAAVEAAPEAESPLMGGRPAGLPAPQLEEGVTEVQATVTQNEAAGDFTCPLCPDKHFTFRSYYIRHLKRKHPDRLAELTPPA